MKEATHRAGASAAYLIEQPMAAAIGAGLSIHEPIGNMVVDVGGGTSETAVISLGGVVASEAIRCGGFDIDAAIQTYVRREHGVAIGERTAEEIKLAIGSAAPYNGEVKAEVRGPRAHDGHAQDGGAVARGAARRGRGPGAPDHHRRGGLPGRRAPELAQDIIFQGIHLVGGGALLRGMARRLANETAVPVHLVDTPLECVALGAGQCLESFDKLRQLFVAADA